MNRLRRHKKEKAAKEELAQSEKAASSTTTIISSITPTKKEKEPASKKDDDRQTTSPKVSDFDLANALPAPDDFRTSLLMPKLSARFSMLKEQDDPESLLGKASDDSVLFSKRASRLNMFSHPNQLADIDEMSINSRPSAFGQAESNDGYGTDDDRSQAGGSMMSRARRAEVGNNLFGGRQKVYKVPARSRGASPNPGPEAGRSGLGRAVYEHDVTLSAFQRLRLKEKEERAAAEDSALNSPTFSNEDALSSIGSTNRTTYSSTASGPPPTFGRASTAATSVDGEPITPQSIEGSAGKQFPFPERGAPKPTRRYGQGLVQSVQNQQNLTLNRLESLSRQRPGTPEFPQMNRAFSRSATSLRDRLQRLPLVDAARPSSRPTSPPLSAASPRPQLAESESKDPVPSGYGTPSGYNAPPLSPPISEVEEKPVPLAAALQPEDHGKATALGLFNKPRAPFDEQQFTRRQLQMHQGRSTPPLRQPPSPPRNAPPPAPTTLPQERVGRSRGISNASSYRSRPGSASSHYSEASKGMNRTTFFSNSSPSDSGDEDDEEDEEDIHPAFRSRSRSRTPSKPSTPPGEPQERHPLPEVRFSDLGDLKPIAENEIAESVDSQNNAQAPQEPDSPTLGPSGLGLSGLVRTHLRQESDKSIQLPSLGLPPKLTDNRDVPETKQDTADATPTPPPADEPQGRIPNDSSLDDESGDSSNSSHRRNASTETQREREEFANELAERRRKVQEKLQNFTDIESRRSGSPARCGTPDSSSQVKPGNAFALLKSRAGKHHLFQKSGNSSTQSLVNLDQNDPWREEDEKVPFPSLSTQQLNSSTPQIPGDRPSVRSRVAAFTRGNQDASRESSHSRNASPHSFTGFRARRDRSRSDASCRSKSRLRNDDLGTVDERSVASHEIHLPDSTYDPRANTSVPSSTRPSVEGDERSSSRSSGRYRSGSRSGTPSYFDLPPPPQHHPPSVSGPNPAMIGNAPRPSPIAPYSANATPPLDLTPSPSSPPAPTFAAAAGHVVPQRAPGHTGLPKRPINKLQISEPTLLSSTSNVPTVGLPPSASLTNGMETPPVPPMNPRRRRQTTTQTILGALKGEKQDTQSSSPSEYATSGRGTPADERSMFEDERPLSRNRLRKTSSEGGSLSIKARQEIISGTAPPPMPYPPPSYPPPKVPFDGRMF
ncbi:uncharacterized protein ASPGLDRAFT_1497841 [Aspergillus glaucus CBS 516.65]|uniref:Uncharacterized protein n=1 Tax=Aspergillus glaucus CBS 516.65 TaxID=1160497 RepID=A0A1L9VCJ5_ASPGL|nr:hypothetical protein ASPGLDRAFT_1497841 [Aspergillus glaucus CBS 516.65]OJJ81657.1 hypothetical protein ASPGLDRAFT_1497841 [Aspergillus glaucus CBS 516.65]